MKKLLICLICLICLTMMGCTQIENGTVGIKTRWGKVIGEALPPGLYTYIPIMYTVWKLDTKVRTISSESEAASRDLQNVQTKITLNYHLGTQDPINHFIRLGGDQDNLEKNIIEPATAESFKAIVAQFNAEELITRRAQVSNEISKILSIKLQQYDLYIDSMSITNFSFSKGYSEAIEAKQIAEQNANKAKNDLLRINIEAQQKVVEAKAQADAMQLQKAVVTPELIALKQLEIQAKMIEKWSGQLPTTYMGNSSPMMMLNLK